MKKHNRWHCMLVALLFVLLISLTAGCRPALPTTITLTIPQEGDILTAGSTQKISWYAEGTEFDHVCLVYSTDGWATKEFIDESSLKNGTYDWQVPETLSGSCWVAVSSFTHADEWLTGDEAVVFVEPVAAATGLPVINYFTASPTSITVGDSSTISWDVDSANTAISHGVGQNLGAIGNESVSPTVTTTYTLTATNAAGSVTEAVTVTVGGAPATGALPVINSLTASPTSITVGDSSTISWDVDNANTVSISHGVGQNLGGIDSESVSPTVTTTYTLTATNPTGNATATVTVTVGGTATGLPVINSFTANSTIVPVGSCVKLSWKVSNATTVTISGGLGAVGHDGAQSVCPKADTTYTLKATNAAASVTETCTVTVVYSQNLKPEPSESGTIFSDGYLYHNDVWVGDGIDNTSSRGFVSFDITGLHGYSVEYAYVGFSEKPTLRVGDPLTFADRLMFHEAKWGPRALQPGDYNSYKSYIGQTWNPFGQHQSLVVTELVRGEVNGKAKRFQVRIGFAPKETDNDSQEDSVNLCNFNLTVYYYK